MTRHAEHLSLINLYQAFRRRHTQPADQYGFGFSRTDTDDTTEPADVPDGVDLHFFTGRTRQETHR
jgi:hypothetical protein